MAFPLGEQWGARRDASKVSTLPRMLLPPLGGDVYLASIHFRGGHERALSKLAWMGGASCGML